MTTEKKDETEGKKQDPQFDSDKILADLGKILDQKMQTQEEKFNQKLDTMKKADDLDLDQVLDQTDDDDADDEPISKKDLKKTIQAVVDGVIKKTTDQTKKIVSESLSANSTQNNVDNKTMKDFPLLHDQNSKFAKEVVQELREMNAHGASKEDPWGLYNAAARVKSRWVDQGIYSSAHLAAHEARRFNNRDGMFGLHPGGGQETEGLNASDVEMAGKMRMSSDRLKELYKKYGKRRYS